MRRVARDRSGSRRRHTRWLVIAAALGILAGCGGGGSVGSVPAASATSFPTIPLPPVPLVLHRSYPVDGLIINVGEYDRSVDPRTVPIPDARITVSHFVHLVCTVENTLSRDQEAAFRIGTTLYGTPNPSVAGSDDLPPAVLDGVYAIPAPSATLDRLNLVPAGRTVARDVYFWIDDPHLTMMRLYLHMWAAGGHDVRATPPLFLIDVSATAASA